METVTRHKVTRPPNREHQRVQKLRFYSQLFSVLVNIWIGVQFYLWVKKIAGEAVWINVPRPPGVEGWLPIGSLVSLRYWWESGVVNTIHPSGLIIFLTILATAFLFKKGFCGWICPVGFISEMLGNIADKIWHRRLKPPAWLDWTLRMVKYLLLGFFLWAILVQMTPKSIEAFVYSNYNKVADILMLRFFTDITLFALSILAGLFFFSLIIRGFWCRYFCPYGALLGLIGLISPTRIKRNPSSCTDCKSCTIACPAFIKVHKVKEVVSDECIGCMACVDSCPVNKTLEIKVIPAKKTVSPVRWAAILLIVFWGTLLTFKIIGPWQNSITDTEYRQHLPALERGEYIHP